MARLITLLSILFLIGVVSRTAGRTIPEEYFLSGASLYDLYNLQQVENDLKERDATNEMSLEPRKTTDEMDMDERVVPRSRHRRQTEVEVDATEDDDGAALSAALSRQDSFGGSHTASGTYNYNRFDPDSYNLGYNYQFPNDVGNLGVNVGNDRFGINGGASWLGNSGGRHSLSGSYDQFTDSIGGHELGLGYDFQSRDRAHTFGAELSHDSFGDTSAGLRYTLRFKK